MTEKTYCILTKQKFAQDLNGLQTICKYDFIFDPNLELSMLFSFLWPLIILMESERDNWHKMWRVRQEFMFYNTGNKENHLVHQTLWQV